MVHHWLPIVNGPLYVSKWDDCVIVWFFISAIALAHHQLTADNLISAVNKVDIRLLQPDFISSFESMLPDQNEVRSY